MSPFLEVVMRCSLYFLLLVSFVFASVEEEMISHVKRCIEKAEAGISKINAEILDLPGMSSPKVRHFLNNLCSFPGASYLEVGCWKGSTLISALYGNWTESAVAIDDWSQFEGPKEAFRTNVARFIPSNQLRFVDQDCFQVDLGQVFQRPVNIYFFDGDHSIKSQYQAFSYFNPILQDVFIAVVDDWNWRNVRKGTRSAFRNLGYEVLYDRELFSRANGDTSSWWNGLYIAVIKKPPN